MILLVQQNLLFRESREESQQGRGGARCTHYYPDWKRSATWCVVKKRRSRRAAGGQPVGSRWAANGQPTAAARRSPHSSRPATPRRSSASSLSPGSWRHLLFFWWKKIVTLFEVMQKQVPCIRVWNRLSITCALYTTRPLCSSLRTEELSFLTITFKDIPALSTSQVNRKIPNAC